MENQSTTNHTIDGLRFRYFAGPEDYAAIAQVMNASWQADAIDYVDEPDDIVNNWSELANFEPDEDVLIAEIRGEPVAWCMNSIFVMDDSNTQCIRVDGFSKPGARRIGIAGLFMRWQLDRASIQFQKYPHHGPRELRSWSYDKMVGREQLLQGFGFVPFRHGYMMIRTLEGQICQEEMPDGIQLRPMTPDLLEVYFWAKNEAFRDHHGYRVATQRELQAFLEAQRGKPMDGWQVGFDLATGEIAGAVDVYISDQENRRFVKKRGWTDPIFVRRPWRKRGLARALTTRALQFLQDAGMTEACLTVDALNPNGALKLYEGLGFKPEFKSQSWRRAVPAAHSDSRGGAHIGLETLTFQVGLREIDYARAATLSNLSNVYDGIDWTFSEDLIRETWPRLDNTAPDRDFIRIETDKGELAAIARYNWETQLGGTRVHRHNVHMHPDWRRKGIGTCLMKWLDARVAETDATHVTEHSTVVHIDGPDSNVGLAALLPLKRFMPVRHEYIMINHELSTAPDFPLPQGFEIRPVNRAHMREIWQAGNEAFADHWGATVPSEVQFERWRKDPLVRPEYFSVAFHVASGQVAAQVQGFINESENALFNRKRGWTEDISTRRAYRRLGLARALISHSIRMFRAMGMTETALSVDTQNSTGALRVYQDCGYRVVMRETTWEKVTQQAMTSIFDNK